MFTVQQRFPGHTPDWNSASEALLLESAELLGKIHAVLQAYPTLPEGIGAGFFARMTPQRALESYRRSVAAALRLGGESTQILTRRIEWRGFQTSQKGEDETADMPEYTRRLFHQPVSLQGRAPDRRDRLDIGLRPSGHLGSNAFVRLCRAPAARTAVSTVHFLAAMSMRIAGAER